MYSAKTRQKGLQSNSGPVPICFCLLASRRSDRVKRLPAETMKSSYIGELLTAADRCKNTLLRINWLLNVAKTPKEAELRIEKVSVQ